jgi:hypothetical protein
MIRNTFFIFFLAFALSSSNAQAQEGITQVHLIDGIDEGFTKTQIEQNASLLLTAMSKSVIDGTEPDTTGIAITDEAAATLRDLWNTSAMICTVSDVARKCYIRTQGGYQVRDIPVTMLAAPEEEQKQDLALNFTKDGTIDEVFIAIHSITGILEKNITVKDFTKRQKILDFLEQFRTAYNTKDTAHIRKVFSNNALIVTGKVVREKPKSDQALKSNLTRERIEYVTYSKESYMSRLKSRFIINKYIRIEFSEIEIVRHPSHKNVYGVTLKQKWNSSTYNDVGYLFLLIDFKDENEMLIHVRTWQPDKYNGKELSREERFNVSSFKKLNF